MIYRRLEGRDVIADTMALSLAQITDPRTLNFTTLLMLAWAMAKTAAGSAPFPDFETWLDSLDIEFDLDFPTVEILNEASEGLFRRAASAAADGDGEQE